MFTIIADKILGWLSNLHLSLAGYAIALLSAATGALIIAFKLQGSSLHKAKVELLLSKWSLTNTQDEKAVEEAKSAFQKALKEYDDAKNSR